MSHATRASNRGFARMIADRLKGRSFSYAVSAVNPCHPEGTLVPEGPALPTGGPHATV